MPNRDGQGPWGGGGPKTGRRRGPCLLKCL